LADDPFQGAGTAPRHGELMAVQSMIRKSGNRFSGMIMLKQRRTRWRLQRRTG